MRDVVMLVVIPLLIIAGIIGGMICTEIEYLRAEKNRKQKMNG